MSDLNSHCCLWSTSCLKSSSPPLVGGRGPNPHRLQILLMSLPLPLARRDISMWCKNISPAWAKNLLIGICLANLQRSFSQMCQHGDQLYTFIYALRAIGYNCAFKLSSWCCVSWVIIKMFGKDVFENVRLYISEMVAKARLKLQCPPTQTTWSRLM